MDTSSSLDRRLRLPHREANEDGVVSRHAGYTVTYCSSCGQPILHAWRVYHEPVCRKEGCPEGASSQTGGHDLDGNNPSRRRPLRDTVGEGFS